MRATLKVTMVRLQAVVCSQWKGVRRRCPLIHLVPVVIAFASPLAFGGSAVFSKDGEKIFTVGGLVLDLRSGSISKFVVPGLEGESIRNLDRTPSGEIIVLTSSGLHGWNGEGEVQLAGGPELEDESSGADRSKAEYWEGRVYTLPWGKYPCVRIEHAGESHAFWLGWLDDLEEAPERAASIYRTVLAEGWEVAIKGNIPVEEAWEQVSIAYNETGSEIVCYTRAGGLSRWDPHRGRMLGVGGQGGFRSMRGLDFDSDGACYFGGDGDLWYGYIHSQSEDANLAAYRFAPLADLSSCPGNSSAIGVDSITVAGPHVYLHLSRIGGTGWGEVVRIAKAQKRLDLANQGPGSIYPIEFDLSERIAIYGRAMESFESLGVTPGWANLAASPDGRLVYFQAEKEKGKDLRHWLVRDHGDPEEITFEMDD